MVTGALSHTDSCGDGVGVFINDKQPNKYITQRFYRCTWACPGQAAYRISKVAKEALLYHDELTFSWLNDAQHNTMRRRGNMLGQGYMSFSVTDQRHKFVIAAPDLMPTAKPHPGQAVIRNTIDQLVPLGIRRLSKSELWRSGNSGYTRIAYTKSNDMDDINNRLKAAGLERGRVTIDMPLEYLIESVNHRLSEIQMGWGTSHLA